MREQFLREQRSTLYPEIAMRLNTGYFLGEMYTALSHPSQLVPLGVITVAAACASSAFYYREKRESHVAQTLIDTSSEPSSTLAINTYNNVVDTGASRALLSGVALNAAMHVDHPVAQGSLLATGVALGTEVATNRARKVTIFANKLFGKT